MTTTAATRHETVQKFKKTIMDAMSEPGPGGLTLRDMVPADWLMEGLVLVLQSLLVDQNHELDVMWEKFSGDNS